MAEHLNRTAARHGGHSLLISGIPGTEAGRGNVRVHAVSEKAVRLFPQHEGKEDLVNAGFSDFIGIDFIASHGMTQDLLQSDAASREESIMQFVDPCSGLGLAPAQRSCMVHRDLAACASMG